MKKYLSLILIVFCLGLNTLTAQTTYNIDTKQIEHQIDINVYGQFLEHIYNSTNGGLWGDLVWNRSFERIVGSGGEWNIEGDAIVQSSLNENIRLLFGETNWQNYEITLQAQKLGGDEGFLVLFRADGDNFYWLNIGGWGNSQHAIEKGAAGEGRWGVFNGLTSSGSIATAVWYDIKIRCEGNRFQIWFDGDLLFDFTDNDTHFSGQAGIGTWITRATFRNIVVTDISSGDTLYNQLPEVGELTEAEFANWKKSNNARLYRKGDAFNSDFCALLVNPESNTAYIQQQNINIIPQKYYGSFWAKAEPGKVLAIQLFGGGAVLGQDEFTVSGADWEEFTFEFDPQATTTEGILRISTPDSGQILIDQVSLMSQNSIDSNGFRPDLLQAVKDLQPPIIRWPGGCFVSAYFWKDGIGPQEDRIAYPIELWNDIDVNSYGTDEFIQMCRMVGAEPLIVVNTGVLDRTCGAVITKKLEPAQYLQDALDWMEYCNGDITTTWGAIRAANGHPEPYHVKYWEIDNETWSAGINAYVDKVKTFAPAMREKYPDVKIIACGSGSYDYNWNQTLLNECAGLIDYISTHHYENPGKFKTGVAEYEAFVKDLSARIKNSSNPDVEIYMSEWNLWDPIDWRIGLYAGGMLNMFERQGERFTLGGPALWLRHSSAGAWNNAFINFNNSDWFPAPNYVVMKLWREHFAPNFLKTTGSNSSLDVVSTLSADSSTVYFKVVNTSTNNINITLNLDDSFVPETAVIKRVSSPSLYDENTFSHPDKIRVTENSVSVSGQNVSFVSSAYSACVITIKKDISVGVNDVKRDRSSGLFQNVPNPFKRSTKIRFELSESTDAKLQVLDLTGRVVKVLTDGFLNGGLHEIQWEGKCSDNEVVTNGVYFCELITPEQKSSIKMVLSR
ncbi:MAG: T9SS type A sorting domain-containing protein [Mariniphaga sp.]|nr:T9SS type A sorting domain-containing protein [Mariniphaga sp.]